MKLRVYINESVLYVSFFPILSNTMYTNGKKNEPHYAK
jgi:hypothetical protein